MTPSPQHDFAMLKQLSVIFARNDYYKKTSPNLKSYLELLNKCYELSVNSGLYNQELLLLSHEWRKTIASEIEGDQTTREELNNLESHYEHLQAEINFLKNIEQTYQYFPERLPQERQNALEYINRVRQTNCTSAQKIEQINATSKQLEIIKIQNNIFTCGWRLLTKPTSDFKQRELNHCKSNLYILGEWFNAWTQKVRDELSLISMPDLICINNSCDEIKSNLERLSRLYALKKEDTSSFVPEFDKQLLLTLKDIQESFSQQGPVEISRFLHQKTTHFCCLLIQTIVSLSS